MFQPQRLKFTICSLFIIILNISIAIAQVSEDYDLNTEIRVSGVIIEVLENVRGPRVFLLKSEDRAYNVITGPWWYLKKIGLSLENGMQVEVTGSKFLDSEGRLHIVIYSLKDLGTQKTYRFRGDNLMPLWHGMGRN